MKQLHLIISAGIYLFFWCVFSYLLVFIGGPFVAEYISLPGFIKTVDSGPVLFALPWLSDGLANSLLILAFGLQHSVMARPTFKSFITRIVPPSLERSVYVLATCIVLVWLYLAWQPITQTVWHVQGGGSFLLQLMFAMGAGLVLWSTFMISHGQLFGISQAWNALKGRTIEDDSFMTPALYKYSRHPMYLGILIVFWATPVMSVGHLLAASLFSIYVFVGIGYEERDLLTRFGNNYKEYIEHVPQLFPLGFKKLPVRDTQPGQGDDYEQAS